MSDLFDFDKPKDEYAVMGNPIGHSKSPMIHERFAQQTGQHMNYGAILVELGGFNQAVGNFFANGGKGLNVTVPFKQEAFELADRCSQRAQAAAAVNTLKTLDNGDVFGDNTDGVGLIRDITVNLAFDMSDKNILLLGAGGAARGVLLPLLARQPKKLVIANRTVDKAHQLLNEIAVLAGREGDDSVSLHEIERKACGFDAVECAFDLVINATAASLKGEVPALPSAVFAEGALAYDMMYGAAPTSFMQWSADHGAARVSDGLGMLVEQAAESFYLWRDVRPQTSPVIEFVRASLS